MISTKTLKITIKEIKNASAFSLKESLGRTRPFGFEDNPTSLSVSSSIMILSNLDFDLAYVL